MKNIKLYLSTLLIILSVSAFSQKSEERNLEHFTELSLTTAGAVYLKQGDNQQVVVKGSDEALENIETVVRGEKLVIRLKNSKGFNWTREKDPVEIYITMEDIEGLNVSGSGRIVGENNFKTDNLDISVSGSGKIELDTDSKEVEFSISGSGFVTISGTATNVKASISGSGKILGTDLKATSCKVSISGSGRCEVYVEKSLDARISGSGSVYYSGNPENVNSSTSGSGKVKKL